MITIVFHPEFVHNEMAVWADSPDLPGFTAAGNSIGEVRALVREYLNDEAIEGDVRERFHDADHSTGFYAFYVNGGGQTIELPEPAQQTGPLDDRFLVDA